MMVFTTKEINRESVKDKTINWVLSNLPDTPIILSEFRDLMTGDFKTREGVLLSYAEGFRDAVIALCFRGAVVIDGRNKDKILVRLIHAQGN